MTKNIKTLTYLLCLCLCYFKDFYWFHSTFYTLIWHFFKKRQKLCYNCFYYHKRNPGSIIIYFQYIFNFQTLSKYVLNPFLKIIHLRQGPFTHFSLSSHLHAHVTLRAHLFILQKTQFKMAPKWHLWAMWSHSYLGVNSTFV